ncbi:TetR/AcrR family transcriptional regulator [Aquihabitans sp. G128]|uniref:TetR/AcrR family transcriptional regulator n=1 Tax=Aquihabitans sp. G128 TaxID=2849779 RepID=UPI001C243406|nr:TetR/AcrR family transcriptional regulator [Aquihabitans sp. G128]QXC60726.1 TetR/AcrR family transcriptional regulator [Aquihabitans sp. G128]
MGPRTRTPSDEVAGSLVEAAVRVIEADGTDALTVRRVAAEAGVSPQGVYNHFHGKQGVVEAVFVRGFDALSAAFAELPREDPREAIVVAAHRYRELAREHPGFYTVMFDRAVPDFAPSEDALAHAGAAFGGLRELVVAAMDAGVLAPGDAVSVAQQLWSALHGAVSLELRGIGFVEDLDAQFDALVASLLRGVAR